MPMAESQNPAADPASAGSPLSVASRRVTSVDALRGFDMFWIIGADVLFYALSEVAGENRLVKGLATQLEHVAWEGFRFYDLIFPMFVFIVGVSLVFSLTRRIAEAGRNTAVLQIFRRAAIIYLLGLFAYDGIAHGFGQIRLLGVLQRIALCYLFAGLAFCYLKPKALVALCVSLLIGYWALMTFVPVPEVGAGNFEEGKNLANYIDREYLPLRKWDKTHDPEGLLSTLPAIASCLLGVFAGMLLRNRDVAEQRKVNLLLAAGAAGVVLGFLWGLQFPVIKKIWTSSFVLVAGGFSAILLAIFYQVIDIWKHDKWAIPFLWIGTNAITIYMLVHIVNMEEIATRIVGGEIKAGLDNVRTGLGSLAIALVALGLCLLFVRFLYKRRIFLRV